MKKINLNLTRIKLENIMMFFGMVGGLVYMGHTTLGASLWLEYDAITMAISVLTAQGSPNAQMLQLFTYGYAVCMLVFGAALILRSMRTYNKTLKIAAVLFTALQVVLAIGLALFPIKGQVTNGSFNHVMHLIVAGIVAMASIAFAYLCAMGYRKQTGLKGLSTFCLVMAILITLFGVFNSVAMGLNLNILGITERLVIFSILMLIFGISHYETFRITAYNKTDEAQ